MPFEVSGIAVTLGWLLFFAGVCLSAVIGAILVYHWIRFAMNPIVPTFAFVIYVAGCVLLLSIMFGSLLII